MTLLPHARDVDPAKLLGVRHPGLGAESYLRLLRRDPCAYCGAPFRPGARTLGDLPYLPSGWREIDHIHARAHGGPNHWTNYTAACGFCNVLKFDNSVLTWLLQLERLARGDDDGALAVRIGSAE